MKFFPRFFSKAPDVSEEPTAQSLHFDLSGWREEKRSAENMVWMNECGEVLSVNVVEGPFYWPLSDRKALIDEVRELAKSRGGAIISADVVTVAGVPAVKLIYKREQRPAYIYSGMLFFPFNQVYFFVLMIVFGEHGTTGVREAVVTSQLLNEGKITTKTYPQLWFRDPYDPEYKDVVLCSLSDDEKYDDAFPDHPLSRMRKKLLDLQSTLTIHKGV
jgi:hypothetical protein